MARFEVRPGTQQWDAWLAYHGNSKEAARMLGCLTMGEPVYIAPSEWPPEQLPSIASAMKTLVERDLPPAKPPRPPRSIDEVAERLEKRAARNVAEHAEHERATEPLRKMRKKLRVQGMPAEQAPAGPTPERGLKAGAHMRQDAVRAYHCEDSPIERLATRRALDPNDTSRNEALRLAAARYYEHWYLSGMSPIGAIDLNRSSAGSETRPVGMPSTELALMHRRKYREAVEALGAEYSAVVDPIVLNEQDVEAVGYSVSRYRDRKQVIAVAMDRLCCGLERLRVHYKIGGLDARGTTMPPSRHESELRSDGGKPRALSRHRSLAGM